MEFLRNKTDWEGWILDHPELLGMCPPEKYPCFAVETVRMTPDDLDQLSEFKALYFDRAQVEQMLSTLRNGK